jgi:DNA processing protein
MERSWWWLWSCCPGLGSARLRALRSVASQSSVGPCDLWTWPLHRLQSVLFWPESCWASVERFRRKHGEAPKITVPANLLLPEDQLWPQGVDHLDRPPVLLHYSGDSSLLSELHQRHAVAVVGTRAASDHGIAFAEDLGRTLSSMGWPVVSGLAEGIDAATHRGCLGAGGRPVAVLGTSLDRVYPRHHQELQAEVSRQGLLLSELSPGTPSRRGSFAERNRLIVALAKALVVVECPESSGALISAKFAAQLQCPVWAVPGDARRWSSRGSNALLQNQAAPLLAPGDLVDHLGLGPLVSSTQRVAQDALFEAIGDGASLEDLQRRLGDRGGHLPSQLLALECQGQLVCEAGHLWRHRRS